MNRIKIEPLAGQDISLIAEAALAVARELSMNVVFKFNGRNFYVAPWHDKDRILQAYHERVQENHDSALCTRSDLTPSSAENIPEYWASTCQTS